MSDNKKNSKKGLIAFLLGLAAVICAFLCILFIVIIPKANANKVAKEELDKEIIAYKEEIKDEINSLNVGDTYSFGTYENEMLIWKVYEKEDNKVFLINDFIIDSKPFNTSDKNMTWEKSSIRKFLNDDFLKASFSDVQIGIIDETLVTADKNPSYDKITGNDTKDKVFLLSIDEARKYFKTDKDRICTATDTALKNGIKADKKNRAWWTLRTVGEHNDYVSSVCSKGDITEKGRAVNTEGKGIRPALWINVE